MPCVQGQVSTTFRWRWYIMLGTQLCDVKIHGILICQELKHLLVDTTLICMHEYELQFILRGLWPFTCPSLC